MLDRINKGNRTCLLRKALYGLKQSGRFWNEILNNILKKLNLQASQTEPCMYYEISENYMIIIIVYVDDMLIAYNNYTKLNEIKTKTNVHVCPVATRPDIMHTVVFLSQFNTSYGTEHWNAVKKIVRYLKNTKDFALIYKKDDLKLNGFVDADWGSDATDRKSFTGYVFKLSSLAILWKSQKQNL